MDRKNQGKDEEEKRCKLYYCKKVDVPNTICKMHFSYPIQYLPFSPNHKKRELL